MNYMATLKALPRDYAKGRVEELLELVDLKDVKIKNSKHILVGCSEESVLHRLF